MIKIKIDADGNTHVEVNGISGASCETLTSQLVAALGDTEEQRYTEEYEQELPDYIESHTDE
jgi:hypothetical protein